MRGATAARRKTKALVVFILNDCVLKTNTREFDEFREKRRDSKSAFVTCKESTALRINEGRHKKKVTDPEQDKTKCDENEDEESLDEQALVQTRTDIYPHADFLLSIPY